MLYGTVTNITNGIGYINCGERFFKFPMLSCADADIGSTVTFEDAGMGWADNITLLTNTNGAILKRLNVLEEQMRGLLAQLKTTL